MLPVTSFRARARAAADVSLTMHIICIIITMISSPFTQQPHRAQCLTGPVYLDVVTAADLKTQSPMNKSSHLFSRVHSAHLYFSHFRALLSVPLSGRPSAWCLPVTAVPTGGTMIHHWPYLTVDLERLRYLHWRRAVMAWKQKNPPWCIAVLPCSRSSTLTTLGVTFFFFLWHRWRINTIMIKPPAFLHRQTLAMNC